MIASFIHHKSYLKPFPIYLPCIAHMEYFSIIFNVKKCALYSIKYGTQKVVYCIGSRDSVDNTLLFS